MDHQSIDRTSIEQSFPAGTPVCVRQTTRRRGRDTVSEIVGVVESWDSAPTGSWFAHSKHNRLWLARLLLSKEDGERTLVVIDDETEIARLEPVK